MNSKPRTSRHKHTFSTNCWCSEVNRHGRAVDLFTAVLEPRGKKEHASPFCRTSTPLPMIEHRLQRFDARNQHQVKTARWRFIQLRHLLPGIVRLCSFAAHFLHTHRKKRLNEPNERNLFGTRRQSERPTPLLSPRFISISPSFPEIGTTISTTRYTPRLASCMYSPSYFSLTQPLLFLLRPYLGFDPSPKSSRTRTSNQRDERERQRSTSAGRTSWTLFVTC